MADSYPLIPITGGTQRQVSQAINHTLGRVEINEDTAANIASKTASVNTLGKFRGKLVWDTTNNRMMRANGPAQTDVWWLISGTTSVTPV